MFLSTEVTKQSAKARDEAARHGTPFDPKPPSRGGAERADILGCPFDAISFEATMARIESAVRERGRLQIVPGNVDFVMKARRSPYFAQMIAQADLVVADGVPITWAARLLGHPLKGRVSGTDLVWRCAEISARTGRPIALLGAGPGVADRAASRMLTAFPPARVEVIPTPMPFRAEDNARAIAQISALSPAIVLVALGAPRQEQWIAENLSACGASVGIGVGSALDIISGDKPRAPAWMADNGLEWLHRLRLEPRRLARRYIVDDSPFFFHLARAALVRQFVRARVTS